MPERLFAMLTQLGIYLLMLAALALAGCQAGTQLFFKAAEEPEHQVYRWQHRNDPIEPIPDTSIPADPTPEQR